MIASEIGTTIEFIDNDEAFTLLCANWLKVASLAVDTEFMRTNTFYAKLGLLQVGEGNNVYLIDPLKINDWTPLKSVCESDSVEFIFHSCSEDLSVFLSQFGFVPRRIFDTQLAAAFLGIGANISYAGLVSHCLDIEVDKDATRTDWLQRPLTDAQLSYASADVLYLNQIRELLGQELVQRSFDKWFAEECSSLIASAISIECEDSWLLAYRNVSNAWRLDDRGLAILRELALWREKTARSRNKPRNWIVKDAELYDIANTASAYLRSGASEVSCRLLRKEGALKELDSQFILRNEESLDACLSMAANRDGQLLSRPSGPLSKEQRSLLKKLQISVESHANSLSIGAEVLGKKRQLLAYLECNLGGLTDKNDGSCWPPELSPWKKAILLPEFQRIYSKHLSSN